MKTSEQRIQDAIAEIEMTDTQNIERITRIAAAHLLPDNELRPMYRSALAAHRETIVKLLAEALPAYDPVAAVTVAFTTNPTNKPRLSIDAARTLQKRLDELLAEIVKIDAEITRYT